MTPGQVDAAIAAIRAKPCYRCGAGSDPRPGWCLRIIPGAPLDAVEPVCPDCQTGEESVGWQVNDSMLEYSLDDAGRVVAAPKIGEPD